MEWLAACSTSIQTHPSWEKLTSRYHSRNPGTGTIHFCRREIAGATADTGGQ